jgi:two-component system, sensor histidine kinase and response regulator
MKHPCRLALAVILILIPLFCKEPSLAAPAPIRIGVLAIRGPEQCLKSWEPTARYLSERILGENFVIIPLAHDQVAEAVRRGDVDFLLSNSSIYVELEQRYGINRIATLKESRLGRTYSQYGGVIFRRQERSDLKTLADLRDRSFMAVSEDSLGGWRMAWRELKEQGIDPHRHFRSLSFGDTHDGVVYAVRDGLVDAGTVRTNSLEELAAEGQIDLADFHVFPRPGDNSPPTPYLCSTREYPNWPMAKIANTPDELAEQVAIALLQMQADSPAALAAGCAGWTIPLNYQPVQELLMALRLGPYQDLGKITLADLLRNYGPWLLVALIFFCSHLAFTLLILRLNRRIKASHLSLSAEIEMHKKLDRQLEQAKQQAEAATLTKSRFLANMSHEIRTPMNGIIAATDLALAEKVSAEVEHYLHIVQNSSYSLLGIINDILDFSKIEAGQLELKERLFRLDEMFDRVMDVFVNQAAEKDIELLLDIDPATPRFLRGDSLRLQQILINLIGNAIKFTGPGGIILVGVGPDEQPRDLQQPQTVLRFTVKDTGTGIAPEYLPLLFEPFTQGDSSSTRKYEGTGLGLSICKRFVTLMHGDIGVTTTLGKGSTFTFSVRLEKVEEQSGSRYIFPPDLHGINVLVVDDSADSRDIMEKMLLSLGFRVDTLASGMDALQRLATPPAGCSAVDLVLIDWKMAELDGIETSRHIRQELGLKMPIIMMTAFSREVQRSTAERVGINGFLTKPIFQSTLFDAIMDAFGKVREGDGQGRVSLTTKASIYKKQLRGCKILVVDDNPTNQEVAQAILKGAGISVAAAGNGLEAVERVAAEAFDAVLMDVQMPKMNGYEATRHIRALPGGGSLPIIAMTAHALKGDEEKCLEAGMSGYVAKPINQDRLFATLWRHLAAQKRNASGNDDQRPGWENNREDVVPAAAGDAPVLDGIDVGSVLQATGLSWTTLHHILQGFRRDNRDTAGTIHRAAQSGDVDSLRQLAHSLKGSAGNIGAGELREAAAALEEACSAATPAEMAPLAASLCEEVERLLRVLEGVAPAAGPGPLASPIDSTDPVKAIDLLTGLAEAIDRADPEEIGTFVVRLQDRLDTFNDVTRTALANLLAETGRYDYDQARQTLATILRSFKEQQ